MELSDVGAECTLAPLRLVRKKLVFVEVIMGIKAPNGDKMFLFDSDRMYDETKYEAIRSFVRGHREEAHNN